ncbi:hypothetical protein N1851_031083 [Merluccius polli]|uniref:Uncharacterized protein n=1 Tax=Merluccius polli TaxID=89951 RepID=A0AA47NQ89_MERPO|nr:hypothetical protein N1851_031083 [Merluccius polli]
MTSGKSLTEEAQLSYMAPLASGASRSSTPKALMKRPAPPITLVLKRTLFVLCPAISSIVKTFYFHLRRIANCLSPPAAESLIHAFISSRLDYCNSLLTGITSHSLHRLQLVQNSAARLLTHTRSREHITPILHSLHWLPIKQRITFKILLLTFKALHHLAPPYLSDLLVPHRPTRALRSSSTLSLTLPRSKLKSFGDRAFCPHSTPTLELSPPTCPRLTLTPHIQASGREDKALQKPSDSVRYWGAEFWNWASSTWFFRIRSLFAWRRGVAEEALRQSVQDAMVSTEHLPALTPKAQSVYNTTSKRPAQHVVPVFK